MTFKSVLAAGALALGVVASGTAQAHAAEVFYGNYRTLAACTADGQNTPAHPDWTTFECRKGIDGTWNLYLQG
ncbi:hypothetical protein AB0N05_04595 [Nocardia sp. NPDC051030]|uniref:hypothetical protein n=1 Tax=Nocardia sp. NPDC051030 TaxID=3155162 RepID=UPI003427A2D8